MLLSTWREHALTVGFCQAGGVWARECQRTGAWSEGVLTLRIPVAEESKPRRVEIGAEVPEQKTIETGTRKRDTTRA